MSRDGAAIILAHLDGMYYVLARSALLLTGAGSIYFFVMTGDVPLWFMGLALVTQIIFFVVKRSFRNGGEGQYQDRLSRKYDGGASDMSGTLEERMLAAAEEYKRGSR